MLSIEQVSGENQILLGTTNTKLKPELRPMPNTYMIDKTNAQDLEPFHAQNHIIPSS